MLQIHVSLVLQLTAHRLFSNRYYLLYLSFEIWLGRMNSLLFFCCDFIKMPPPIVTYMPCGLCSAKSLSLMLFLCSLYKESHITCIYPKLRNSMAENMIYVCPISCLIRDQINFAELLSSALFLYTIYLSLHL